MRVRKYPLIAVAALSLMAATAVTDSASAVPGVGTFTKITTPAHTFTYRFNGAPSAVNHLVISGQTSLDVTSVDILCFFSTATGPAGLDVAPAVAVTGGSFSVNATINSFFANCRLRAVPTGTDIEEDYLGSYSGPIMYSYAFMPQLDGGKKVAFQAVDEYGSGLAATGDLLGDGNASECAVALMATLLVPDVMLRGPGTPQCAFGLPPANLTATGISDASAIRVDGKNAYLPSHVADFLRGDLALPVSRSAITTTFSRTSNGYMKITESAPLKRCGGTNVYPPTLASCSNLVNTGVTFKRVLEVVLGAHQIRVHDSFVSTDGHAHTVAAQYQCLVSGKPTGAPGYIYPGHGTSFGKATLDKVVTGFGSHPKATVLVRSDIYASSVDQAADTQALTWSRPPAKIQFSHTRIDTFAMPYTFNVPANGRAGIAFAESEAPSTAAAKTLAAKAVAAI